MTIRYMEWGVEGCLLTGKRKITYLQRQAKGHFAAARGVILDGDATALFLDQQFVGEPNSPGSAEECRDGSPISLL